MSWRRVRAWLRRALGRESPTQALWAMDDEYDLSPLDDWGDWDRDEC